MNAIIIDDEANSRSTLHLLLQKLCPQVQILAQASNAKEGIALIESIKPDLIFLDIEMPDKNGFELLAEIQQPSFEIIFTTAYHEYAVKAFRFSAIDFLLKPIDPDELIAAIQKVELKNKPQSGSPQIEMLQQLWHQFQSNQKPLPSQRLALSNQDGVHIVDIKDIVWCEALGSYTKFHLLNKTYILVSKIVKEYEEILSEFGFIRVHNTYLVNSNYIIKYIKGDGGQLIMSDGSEIEVSRRKKEEVLSVLNRILK